MLPAKDRHKILLKAKAAVRWPPAASLLERVWQLLLLHVVLKVNSERISRHKCGEDESAFLMHFRLSFLQAALQITCRLSIWLSRADDGKCLSLGRTPATQHVASHSQQDGRQPHSTIACVPRIATGPLERVWQLLLLHVVLKANSERISRHKCEEDENAFMRHFRLCSFLPRRSPVACQFG